MTGSGEWYHLDHPHGVVVHYLLRGTHDGRNPRLWLRRHRTSVRAALTDLKRRMEGGRPPGAEPHPDLLSHQSRELDIFATEVAAHEREDGTTAGHRSDDGRAMTCPTCQASNPETAQFCGQCYQVFVSEAPAPATPALESVAPVVSGAVTTVDGAPGGADTPGDVPARPEAKAGRFVTVEGEARWTCAVCDSLHPLEEFVCDICGTKMDMESGGVEAAGANWEDARRLELMAPGLGHIRTGQTGMGYARLGVTSLWAVGALFLLLAGGTKGLLVALPLLFGIVAVWGTGPGDVTAVRADRSPRLDARRFMYLVIGVTAGLIMMGGVAAIL